MHAKGGKRQQAHQMMEHDLMGGWQVNDPPSAGLHPSYAMNQFDGLQYQPKVLHEDQQQLSMLNFALSED